MIEIPGADLKLEILVNTFELGIYHGRACNLCRLCGEEKGNKVAVQPGKSFHHLADEQPLVMARIEDIEKKKSSPKPVKLIQTLLEVLYG
jgi:hypothetical protein